MAVRAADGEPRLRTAAVGELSDRDLAAWRDLAARAVEPNPFFEPEMLVPAAALHHGVRIGLIEADGELLGALPLRRALHWRRIPGTSVATWRHADCYLGTPLLTPEAPEAAIGALLDAADAGLVAFEWLATGGPVEAAVQAAAAARGLTPIRYETFERAALHRRPECDYLQTLSKHRARELRRHRRQLSEEFGAPLEVHHRPHDPDAIESYLRAEAAGWKSRKRTHFLASPESADFFRAVCARFAQAGRLQFLVLTCGGQDIAWKVNLIARDSVFCFKIAYDTNFARYSPGVQLELAFVDLFHSGGWAWSDSCAAPDNAMINRLWPDRRSISTLLVPTGGPRGAAAHSVRAVIAARRRIRGTDDRAA